MTDQEREAKDWQSGVWKRMSSLYHSEWDIRFADIHDVVIERARLVPGERVLDLGTGTGSVALKAAAAVGPSGRVVGVDLSDEMIEIARNGIAGSGLANLTFQQGTGESIPAPDHSFDVVVSSLTVMYVIDRATAATEFSRVLRPGGRLVATVWADPDECDIVQFQQAAGSYGDSPPVPGVGPGALSDPAPFLQQLREAGIDASVESELFTFDFADFQSAWEAMAGVTTSQLTEERRQEAQSAVMDLMYDGVDGPRQYRNLTHFITGQT